MRKLLLIIIVLISFGLPSIKAQVTITQADFAQANDTVVLLTDTMPIVSIGIAGQGQTWDFTSLVAMRIDSNFFKDTMPTGIDTLFSNANLKWISPQLTTLLNSSDSLLEIEGVLGQQIELMGFSVDFGVETAFPFSDPLTIIEFPSAFDSSYKDTSKFTFTMDGSFITEVTIDSIRIKHASFLESIIDAEGTVTNPGDTIYNAIRQYKKENRVDSVEIYVTDFLTAIALGVPLNTWSLFQYDGFDNPILDSTYSYTWYANNQKFPITTIEVDVNNNPLRASWLYTNNLTAMVKSTTNSSCTAASNGVAEITIIGGTQPYTYNWDNGETTLKATALTSGNHSFTVSDNTSASAVVSVTVDANANWNFSIVTTPMTCDDCNDGKVETTNTGGTSPYTYAWNTGATTSSITGLSGGANYSVTIMDVNGCSASKSTYISGIEKADASNISLFPNPINKGILNVNTSEKIEFNLFNMLGELLISKSINTNEIISLSAINSGVYLAQIKSVKGTITQKIIIE